MGIILYGFSLYTIDRSKIKKFIGLLFIFSGIIFHKSLFIIIIAFFVSKFIRNRKILILTIISFPFLITFFQLMVIYAIEEEIQGISYLNDDLQLSGIGTKINTFLNYFIIIIILIWYIWKYLKYNFTKNLNTVFKFFFSTIYIWGLFYFFVNQFGVGGQYLSQRIFALVYTIIPIIMYYFYMNEKNPFFKLFIWVLSCFVLNYRLIYSFYLQNLEFKL